VLGGLNKNALPHEAGGIADFGYVAASGWNFKIIQVGPAKDNAGTGWSRQ